MSKIKNIEDPVTFLLDTGLLFEINRQILHPFGLALGVMPSEGTNKEVGEFTIWDEREDPEGIVFSPDSFVRGVEKLNKFLEDFGIEKMSQRGAELDFISQEYPDAHMKKNGVTLLTYNPDYDAENEDSHNLVAFKVPYAWLQKESAEWFEWSISELLDEYTYDTTEPLYAKAKAEGVIIEEGFAKE